MGYTSVRTAARRPVRRVVPLIAAAVAALMLVCAGVAAVNKQLRDSVVLFFASTFSPKEVVTTIEGEEEIGLFTAVGVNATRNTPGFRLYYDSRNYLLEQDSPESLRIYAEAEADLPECSLTVTHLPGTGPEQALRKAKEEFDSDWEFPEADTGAEYSFFACNGYEWNAPRELQLFVDDTAGGSYQIICKYFSEAAEGHGARLNAMLSTFTVLLPLQGAVEEYTAAYDSVLEAYRTAMRQEDPIGYALEHGLSEFVGHTEELGYTLTDIDGDGCPELLIAAYGDSCFDAPAISELYTMADGKPVQLLCSRPRARYYLLSGNRIILPGSGGAAVQALEFCTIRGGELAFLEGYCSVNSQDSGGDTFYHTAIAQTNGETISGDYDRYDSTLTRAEAEILMNGLDAKTELPALEKLD